MRKSKNAKISFGSTTGVAPRGLISKINWPSSVGWHGDDEIHRDNRNG